MKNAIVKLGLNLLFLFMGYRAFAAPPTVAITKITTSPTNAASIEFDVVFSEDVTGFTSSDVTLTGVSGTSAAVSTITPSHYKITVTGHTTPGNVSVQIPASSATAVAAPNDPNAVSNTETTVFDNVKPTITIAKAAAQADPTSTSPIIFTATFSEPIDPATFILADVKTTGSTTGGTLTVTTISEIAPMDKTKYDITITLTGGAAGNVAASISAGDVSDVAGNTNTASNTATVAYTTGTKPTVARPTVTGISDNDADLNGNVTAAGSSSVTARGFYYQKNKPLPDNTDIQVTSGTGTGTFTQNISSLTSASHYYVVAYATNGAGTTFSSVRDFWTLSTQPSSAPTPGMTVTATTAKITFPKASTIGNAKGYVILRKKNSEPPTSDLPDGIHPDSLAVNGLPANSSLVTIITDDQATEYTDSGIDPCSDYYYVAVAYNWDGTNPRTTNYRYGGTTFNEVHAVTWCSNSTITRNGSPAQLDYASKTGSTITTSSDGLQVISLKLRDGGASNDADDRKTEIASIKIKIDHPEYLKKVAYIDGGYVNAQDPAAVVEFILPSGTTIADDNSNKDFAIYATFQTGAVIDDQLPIKFEVDEAIARLTGANSAGSGFASANAGNANVTSTIDVIATKVEIFNVTTPVSPGNDFSLSARAVDNFGHLDKNNAGNFTISKDTGSGTFTIGDGATKAVAPTGQFTWTQLKFDEAGNKVVRVAHSIGGVAAATTAVNVISQGVDITAPIKTICFNTASTNTDHSSYTSIGPIVIKERDGADFAAGNGQTFSLLLPEGFIFDVTSGNTPPSIVAAGTQISGAGFVGYTGNNVARFKYDISTTGGANRDQITINLQVKYIGTTVVTSQPIFRVGGSAMQVGNAEDDAKPLALLTSGNGSIAVDFQNSGGAAATQTSFSASSSPIILQGIKVSDNSPLGNPYVKFTGDGVAYDGVNYKFNPGTVSDGTHSITFTYSDPAAPGCLSTATKVYSVFSALINGLGSKYCVNDAPSVLGNPTVAPPYAGFGFQCVSIFNGLLVEPYTIDNRTYQFKVHNHPTDPKANPGVFVWNNLPNQGSFNPGAPQFTNEINLFGKVEVRVVYNPNCTGWPQMDVGSTDVIINNLPVISIRNNFPYGICATDQAQVLDGDKYEPSNGFDEFWSTVNGSNTPAPGVSGSRPTFTFTPLVANPGSSDVRIDIHYRHRDINTLCVAEVVNTVDVWGKPNKMTQSQISSGGTPNIKDAQFCFGSDLEAFTTPAVTSPRKIFHKWYYDQNIRPAQEGDLFIPSKTDFSPYAVNAVANYKVTQIDHRFIFTFFGTDFVLFPGCESDPLDLTVTIKRPTLVTMDKNGTMCLGNDLELASLHYNVDSPDAGINGTWTSTGGGTFLAADKITVNTSYTGARYYRPSNADKADMKFSLKLESTDPIGPCDATSAETTVTISPGVEVSFPASPIVACSAAEIAIVTKVTNGISFTWSEAGNGQIKPGTEHDSKAVFQPTDNQQDLGATVQLHIETADPDDSGPCLAGTGDVNLIIVQKPNVSVAPVLDICTDKDQSVTFQLAADPPGATSSADTWNWSMVSSTSLIPGTIQTPNARVSNYTPSKGAPGDRSFDNPGLLQAPATQTLVFSITASKAGDLVCDPITKFQTVKIHARPVKNSISPVTNTKYCQGDPVTLLTSSSQVSPAWYDNTASPGNTPVKRATPFSTDPSVLPPSFNTGGEAQSFFWLTQTFDKDDTFIGCESDTTLVTLRVHPNPVVNFTTANLCFGDIMQFTNSTTIANAPWGETRSIKSYQWVFGDGETTTPGAPADVFVVQPGSKTSGSYQDPGHKYQNAGGFIVRLTAVTSNGCTGNSGDKPVRVGTIPVANFTLDKQCFEDATAFKGTSSLPINEERAYYTWDFGDGATDMDTLLTAPSHQYGAVGTYNVSLTIKTRVGCENTIIKPASILPYIKTFPYIENFEGPNHGWVAEGLVTNGGSTTSQTSWSVLSAANSITSDPGIGAGPRFWASHTNTGTIDVYYYDNERSVVYGPCVDMTQLQRPVLAMDYFNDTELNGDGVYVEYRDESVPNAPWVRLGDVSSGLNWYKQSSIGGLATLNGIGQNVSQFGWSGTTNDAWVTGRYNLDPFSTKNRIRFRVVFGSNASPVKTETYDGFAFDLFKLETRNRLVLVENFTSKSASATVAANTTAFKAFPASGASSEVVKIEYHTGLPAVIGDPADPIFTQNPMDPNARASFYGLSAVPRAYIDGYTGGNGMFVDAATDWAAKYYSTESLKTSPLDIMIEDPTLTNGVLKIKGTVKAKDFDLKANQYSLYVAVVEQAVGNDAFVLRKMLPSASGSKVPATAAGSTFSFEETWSVDRAYLSDNPSLIVVAFVQSDIINADKERQVLQAAYNSNVPDVKFNNTTGLEVPFLEQTALYPNPADRLVTVELPEATDAGVEVTVLDQVGRQVQQGSIGVGQKSTTIDTGNLAGAMYIVQLRELGKVTTRKLVIAHKH